MLTTRQVDKTGILEPTADGGFVEARWVAAAVRIEAWPKRS